MRRLTLLLLALVVVTANAQTNAKRKWELVRSVPNPLGGTVDLVLVPVEMQRDRVFYMQVADEVCRQRRTCMVEFWTERKPIEQILESGWMPVSTLALQTASYERHPTYEKPALHLACWLYPNKAAGEQDKCEYQPGAKKPSEF